MTYASEAGDFSIALAGDCMLTRRLSLFDEPAFLALVKIFRDCDAGMANLESVVRHWDEGTPGIGEKHDFIRGVVGNFEKFERTLHALLDLRGSLPNLALGIHTVVSVFSVGHLEEVMAYADRSGADQFITEIAEPRVELDTVGLPITPTKEQYQLAIDRLIAHVQKRAHVFLVPR